MQTTPLLFRLYKSWVGVMGATEVGLRRPEALTKDTLGNALLLWARKQPPEHLAKMLEPYMDEFDKIWNDKAEAATGTKSANAPQVSETIVIDSKAARKRRGAS